MYTHPQPSALDKGLDLSYYYITSCPKVFLFTIKKQTFILTVFCLFYSNCINLMLVFVFFHSVLICYVTAVYFQQIIPSICPQLQPHAVLSKSLTPLGLSLLHSGNNETDLTAVSHFLPRRKVNVRVNPL